MGIFVPYYISQLRDVTLSSLADDDFLQRKGGAWVNRTIAQVKADLSLSGTNSGDQTISLSGDVTGSGTGAITATIANNAVTLAKMATVATASFLGRVSASTGNVEALTGTQATSLLDAVVGDSGSGGTKGLVPAPAAGDAAASKYLKADGTWATVSASASAGGSDTQVQYNNSGAFDGNAGLTVNKTTGAVTQTQNALGTTTAAGITLQNTTAAALNAQQISPSVDVVGQGWESGTSASYELRARINLLPVQGTNVTGTLQIQMASKGSTPSNIVTLTQGGVFTVNTSVIVGGTNNYATLRGANSATGGLGLGSANLIAFSSGTAFGTGNISGGDTLLGRQAAATLRLGAADAAAPVAQTLGVQSVVAGTSNAAGANWTFTGSRGTGTGAGGDIIFQTAAPGSSGTSQNTLGTNFTMKGDAAKSSNFAGPVGFPSYAVSGLPAAASYPYHRAFVTDASAPSFGSTVSGGGSTKCPVWSDGTNWIVG